MVEISSARLGAREDGHLTAVLTVTDCNRTRQHRITPDKTHDCDQNVLREAYSNRRFYAVSEVGDALSNQRPPPCKLGRSCPTTPCPVRKIRLSERFAAFRFGSESGRVRLRTAPVAARLQHDSAFMFKRTVAEARS